MTSKRTALSPALGCTLAAAAFAGPAAAQQIDSAIGAPIDLPRTAVQIGQFDASRPLRILEEPEFATRALGDTFDSEVLVADSPLINEFAWVSAAPGGQSLLSNGFFQPAGVSQLNGFPVEAGVAEFDNGDGTRTIVVTTRIDPFSDGFLPLGFTFSPSGNPIDTIGWLFGAGADRDANPDAYDPQLAVDFPPSGEFTVVDANIFLVDNGILVGSGAFGGLPYTNQTDMGFFLTVAGAAGSNIDLISVEYLVQSATAPTELELNPADDCLDASENQLVVEIDAQGLQALAVGGQFFLDYDESLLDFVSADPGDGPFTVEIYESVNETTGTIDYAVGVPNGDTGTAVPTTMARITFDVLGDFCETADLVTFRPGVNPPSRITDATGTDLGAGLIDLDPVTKDSLSPIVSSPSAIALNADAGMCDAVVVVPPISASDNCSTVAITNDFTGTDDASGIYPAGTTTVTWTVTDACGNETQVTQDITVNPVNTVEVAVELRNVNEGPGIILDGDLSEWPAGFSNGVAANGPDQVEVFSAWAPDGLYLAFAGNDTTDGRALDEDDALTVHLGLDGNAAQTAWNQDFESNTSGWFDISNGWFGSATQVPSGTNGITSNEGASHAIFDGDASSAPFSRFDMYRDTWTGNYAARTAIYLDPSWALGEGFDYAVASNGSDNNHQRDFIFHVTKDTSTGDLIVAGSNNTNFAPREDLDTLANNYVVPAAGWYTFEHAFRNDAGVLAVDLKLYDASGSLLFTETRTTPADTIPAEVGGNRYAWFTVIDVTGGIPVDDHTLTINGGADWRYSWNIVSDSGMNTGPVGDPSGSGTPGDYWGTWAVGDDATESDEATGAPAAIVNNAPASTGIQQKTAVSGAGRVTELFIPNAQLFDAMNGWTTSNRDALRFAGTFTPDAAPNAFAYPDGSSIGDQSTYLPVAGDLAGSSLALDRCIAFELTPSNGDPAVIIEQDVAFINGLGSVAIEVPCGDYDCISARDTRHTLRMQDSDDFMIAGTVYTADFTANGASDDDSLPGGNFNDDEFIDILDFGVFISQFGIDPNAPGGDTLCGSPTPDADASGNGMVGTEDFTFIQTQFLLAAEATCASNLLTAGSGSGQIEFDAIRAAGPYTSIATDRLADLGMGELAGADLNHDGVLDTADIAAFLGGARPDRLADLNADGVIDRIDITTVVNAFHAGDPAADVNRDGRADLADLAFVLERIGLVIDR